jgi:hypothetical protein
MKDREKIMGARADATTAAARAIVDAEKAEHDAKMARLKKARLAKEAADILALTPTKPRPSTLKAKRKR